MKIIELMGIPGSGKTRYLNRLTKSKDLNLISKHKLMCLFVENKLYLTKTLKHVISDSIYEKVLIKIYKYFRFDKMNQSRFKAENNTFYDFFVKMNNQRSIRINHKEKINHWFLRAGEYYVIAKSIKSDNVFINDEGFYQRISSLFISREDELINKNILYKYIADIPKIDKLIFIKRDIEKCTSARIENKGYRLRGLSENKLRSILQRNDYLMNKAFKYILTTNIETEVKHFK